MSEGRDPSEKLGPDDMFGIPIEEFVFGNKVPVAVFVRLSERKFIKVAHEGASAQVSSLFIYQDKKVDRLWIKKTDMKKINEIHVQLLEAMGRTSQISLEQKTKASFRATKSMFDLVHVHGLSENIMYVAKRIADVTVKMVDAEKEISHLLDHLVVLPNEFVRHSMAVSALSVFIAAVMDWRKEDMLQKLALGGLLHDMGLQMLPPELLSKPKAEYTTEERKLYETHPEVGMRALAQITGINRDILAVVHEHHENSLTEGFPQKLRDYRINPLARVCALANAFAELTVTGRDNPTPVSPLEAVLYIENIQLQPFNKDIFKALKAYVLARPGKARVA